MTNKLYFKQYYAYSYPDINMCYECVQKIKKSIGDKYIDAEMFISIIIPSFRNTYQVWIPAESSNRL